MIIDTHCHIQDFGNRVGEVWARSVTSGVTCGIVVGTSRKDCVAARQVARSLVGLHFAGGLHPVDAARFRDEWADIAAMCVTEECVAVGETGLDFFKGPDVATQVNSLEAQLEFAAKLGKPVILHVRGSGRNVASIRKVHETLFSVLRQHRGVTCVFHCFSGTVAEARLAVDMGHYLSFAGTLTFGEITGRMLSEAAAFAPPDRIMVETDAPYLRPVGCPSKRNEPAFIRLTLTSLATARGWTLDQTAFNTTANAMRALRLTAEAEPST
ncbi:MAG: TatD family hydrolase [Gemmataceae bacterium]|nr:TatD family hydrolase [Gemmataceae bacterium]